MTNATYTPATMACEIAMALDDMASEGTGRQVIGQASYEQSCAAVIVTASNGERFRATVEALPPKPVACHHVSGELADDLGAIALVAIATAYGKSVRVIGGRIHAGAMFMPHDAARREESRAVLAAIGAMPSNASNPVGLACRNALGWMNGQLPPRAITYTIVPERDMNRSMRTEGETETAFTRCDEDRAEQWAVYTDDGVVVGDLVEDYPTRAAAEAAVAALLAGEPLPTPEWPREGGAFYVVRRRADGELLEPESVKDIDGPFADYAAAERRAEVSRRIWGSTILYSVEERPISEAEFATSEDVATDATEALAKLVKAARVMLGRGDEVAHDLALNEALTEAHDVLSRMGPDGEA